MNTIYFSDSLAPLLSSITKTFMPHCLFLNDVLMLRTCGAKRQHEMC